MPDPESSIQEVQLDGAVPASDPEIIPIPRGGELEVRDFTGTIWLRLNKTDAERRPVRSGETICYEQGLVTKVLFDNGGGDGGSVAYEVRHNFTVRGFGGSAVKRKQPQPARLSGALKPGTVIAAGEEASETVDVSDASELRVRARVSGTLQLTSAGTATDPGLGTGTGDVALDPANSRAWAVGGGTDLVEFDLSTGAPVVAAAVTPTGAAVLNGVAYDPVHDVVIVQGHDGADTRAYAFDVSTVGTPSFEGAVTIFAGVIQEGTAPPALDTGREIAWVPCEGQGVATVDYAAPAAPTLQGTNTTFGVGVGAEVYVEIDEADDTVLVLVAGSTLFSWSATDTTAAGPTSDSVILAHGSIQGFGIDRARDLFFTVTTGGVNDRQLAVISYASLGALVVRDTYQPAAQYGSLGVLPDSDLVYLASEGSAADVELVSYEDAGALEQFETVANIAGLGAQIAPTLLYDDVLSLWFLHDAFNDRVQVLSDDPGSDQLHLIPLLTDGSRATTGLASRSDLEDGVERLQDLDLGGETEVEVVVKARSGVPTTIDYIEEYRR